MQVRISSFRIKRSYVKEYGLRCVARFTAQMDHFRFYGVKLMEDHNGEFKVWAPPGVRFSMEGRAAILRKAEQKFAVEAE